jgi:hypothetical protein
VTNLLCFSPTIISFATRQIGWPESKTLPDKNLFFSQIRKKDADRQKQGAELGINRRAGSQETRTILVRYRTAHAMVAGIPGSPVQNHQIDYNLSLR